MADQLDLSIVLKAILDAKGFTEAQAAIKGLAGAANNSAPSVENLGNKSADLTKQLGGSRGAVADLTRVLLQNIGVTGPAGEVAKAAGTSMNLLAGGATLAAAGATGLVAAVALLLPSFIEWLKNTDALTESQKGLRDSLASGLASLEGFITQVGRATDAEREFLRVSRDAAFQAETDTIRTKTQRVDAIMAEIRALRERQRSYDLSVQGLVKSGAQEDQNRRVREKSAEGIRILVDEGVRLNAELNVLEEANRRGTTVEENRRRRLDDTTDSIKEHQDALAFEIRLSQALGDIEVERLDEQMELREFGRQQAKDAEKDIEAFGKTTSAQRSKDLKEEGERLDAYRNLKRQEQEIDRRVAQQKTEQAAATAGAFAFLFSSLAALFSKNKALNIAAAIADTYAGAAKAFAQGGVFGFVTGAAIIAQGLAYVQQIRKAEPEGGFDVPANDRLAQFYGEKWGRDLLEHMDRGVRRAAQQTIVNNNQTTVNRGSTFNLGPISGVIGDRTQFRRWLAREMTRASRFENRTSIRRTTE